MKILISGASGLIGTNLIPSLETKGHEVYRLVRKTPKTEREIQWDPEIGFSPAETGWLENCDSVVHLAGDNIASENWSDAKKKKIRDSRVVGTRVLVDALKNLKNPPKTFISIAGIGIYGDGKDEVLTENSPLGEGFLPATCAEWEAEARKAESFTRVVVMRTGVVLAREGGALEKMLTPFKLGVGGRVGSGKQWMSWISIDDLVSIINFFLENPQLEGVFNVTAPNPVTNEEFTRALGHALSRPTILAIPEFAIKLMFGEMGERLLLEGARVLPERLEAAGYKFQYPEIESALKHVLS